MSGGENNERVIGKTINFSLSQERDMKKKIEVKAKKRWVNPRIKDTHLDDKRVFFACTKTVATCCSAVANQVSS